jgi:hypothetical protein
MLEGPKEHKLYFMTQLIKDYDSLPNDKLPKAIFRYNGKASEQIRHFRPDYHQAVNILKSFNQVINF